MASTRRNPQQGVITRQQALDGGLTPAALRWRLASGAWQQLHRGVYLTHNGPTDWSTRARAALLQAGEGSALVNSSAAYIWRLTTTEPARLEVGVPLHRHPVTGPGITAVRRRRLTAVMVGPLRATNVAQTIVDLADDPAMRWSDVVSMAARAAQRSLVTEERILAELAQRRRHHRRQPLALACGELGSGSESVAEMLYLAKVQRPHGLPTFTQQVKDSGSGARADFRQEQLGIIVEVDGRLWHAGDRFHSDRRRDRRAAANGVVTVRATWLDIDQEPCALARDLWAICRRRGWTEPIRPCGPRCTALAAAP